MAEGRAVGVAVPSPATRASDAASPKQVQGLFLGARQAVA